jgi:hypothetical protein
MSHLAWWESYSGTQGEGHCLLCRCKEVVPGKQTKSWETITCIHCKPSLRSHTHLKAPSLTPLQSTGTISCVFANAEIFTPAEYLPNPRMHSLHTMAHSTDIQAVDSQLLLSAWQKPLLTRQVSCTQSRLGNQMKHSQAPFIPNLIHWTF